MAFPSSERPDGAPPAADTPKKKPDEVVDGGLKREHFKAAKMVEAIDGLPKDKVWTLADMSPVTLEMARALELSRSIYGMDRSADFYAKDAVDGVLAKMDAELSRWQDGYTESNLEILKTAEERKEALRISLKVAMIEEEKLSFVRVALTKGAEVSDDENDDGGGDPDFVSEHEGGDFDVDDDEAPLVIGDFKFKAKRGQIYDYMDRKADCKIALKETGDALRTAEADPKVQEAHDFFTLIGCSPEKAVELVNNGALVESREELSFWLRRQSTGFDTLVTYYGEVVKATSDLDTAGELLTRSWNDKPGNTEMFATLVTPEMNMAVTEVMKTMLNIDIIPDNRIVRTVATDQPAIKIDKYGKQEIGTMNVKVVELLGDPELVKYGLVERVGNKVLAKRSIFSGEQTPEERRLWLRGMERLVTDKLRAKGVKDASGWAKQAVPVALAWQEILLLAPRAGVRRDEKGNPFKVAKQVMCPDGVKRYLMDMDGKVIYETEENGPSTMSGWLNDLEEKASRTKDRVRKEGTSGHSAPPMLAAFAAPDRALYSMMERTKFKVGTVETADSMLDAIRTGKATAGECLKQMTESGRAVEALFLFRVVQLFNGLTPPLADIKIVTKEREADPKHLAEVTKYFTTLTKALRALYGKTSEPWKVQMGQINAVAQMVAYAESNIPTEGGNVQNMSKEGNDPNKLSTKMFKGDERYDAIESQLTEVTQTMTLAQYEYAKKLGKSGSVEVLLPSDVEGSPRLKALLLQDAKNSPNLPFARVSRIGADGALKAGTAERKKAIEDLL